MKKPLALALLTTAGFACGLGVGLWIGVNHVPTPPPPAWVFSEFRNVTRPGMSLARLVQARPNLWRAINAELQSLRPQMEGFKLELETIDGDFRRDLDALLNDNQKKRLEEAIKRKELPRLVLKKDAPAPAATVAAKPAAGTSSPAAATDGGTKASEAVQKSAPAPAQPKAAANAAPAKEEVERQPKIFFEAIDGTVASFVFIPYTHERFTQLLGLDERQQVRLRDLLLARRARFMALADEQAPPSLQLNRIAELIRKEEAEDAKRK